MRLLAATLAAISPRVASLSPSPCQPPLVAPPLGGRSFRFVALFTPPPNTLFTPFRQTFANERWSVGALERGAGTEELPQTLPQVALPPRPCVAAICVHN